MSTTIDIPVTDLMPIGSIWGPPVGFDWQDKDGRIQRSIVIGYDTELDRVVLRQILRTYGEGFGTPQERTVVNAKTPLIIYFGVKYAEITKWIADHQEIPSTQGGKHE